MAGDDTLDQCQPYTGSANSSVIWNMEALEDAEELVTELHVEADAVVPDVIDRPLVPGQASRLDHG